MGPNNDRRKVAIVTDSTAYLPPDIVTELDIHVVPLCLLMGGHSWLDGVEIDPPAFYQLLQESADFPTTSQPNVATFQQLFSDLSEKCDAIVGIFISNDLSGTVDSATAAAANLPDIDVAIIDSRGTTMMLGFVVLEAALAAHKGMGLAEVVAVAEGMLEKVKIYFVVDTLEYLHRGGRIGAAAKLLGSALNLKPILEISDGIIRPVTKVRTRRKALQKVLCEVALDVQEGDRVHMAVINVAAPEEAAAFKADLLERFRPVELLETEVSPVIGAHAGPGTVGVAYYVE